MRLNRHRGRTGSQPLGRRRGRQGTRLRHARRARLGRFRKRDPGRGLPGFRGDLDGNQNRLSTLGFRLFDLFQSGQRDVARFWKGDFPGHARRTLAHRSSFVLPRTSR